MKTEGLKRETKIVKKYKMTTDSPFGGSLYTEELLLKDSLDDAIEFSQKLVTKRSINEPVVLLSVIEVITTETRTTFKGLGV